MSEKPKKEQTEIFDDEKDILLDHDYDGIRELDNHMPGWWVFGFWFSILFAVLYLMYYQVLGWGPSPEEEYQMEMASAVKVQPVDSGSKTDWADLVYLTDASSVENGKILYNQICNVCHGSNGEGLVGPDLTDKYWMHGCDLQSVMSSIKTGFPSKGMPPNGGGKSFDANELQLLASYIHSLQGSKPANAKPHDPAREVECE